MKKQKRMFFKEFVKDNKPDLQKFKTATGSPILYTRLRKHKGIYYPLTKHHVTKQLKPQHSHKHAAVVYSRTYGREVYGNIDIWPEDDTARERLLEKLKGLSLSQDDDVGIDSPTGLSTEEDTVFRSTEASLQTKPPDEKRHVTITVTDTAEDETPVSGDKQTHPVLDRPGSPPEDQGNWPSKRAQSIDSRDNPFLPGGDLSKEADDILSKATIIRDTFILTEENKSAHRGHVYETPVTKTDNTVSHSAVNQSPVKETFTEQTVAVSENAVVQNASPTRTRPKENGKVDTENSLTPGSVTLDFTEDNKDKKKQKKCCVVM